MIDANEHTIDGSLRTISKEEGVSLEQYSCKYWDRKPPNTFLGGKDDNIYRI